MGFRQSTLLIFILMRLVNSASASEEASQTFTLDGRLYADSTATAPLSDIVTLKIQILNPSENCILYEETQSVDTTASQGYYTIQIGQKSGPPAGKRTGGDSNNSMAQVFSNSLSSINGKLLSDGTTACTYNPLSGDMRYLKITMTPTSDGIARSTTTNMRIDSVPMALVSERAENLRGYLPNNFIQVNNTTSALTQGNLESLFTTTGVSRLTDLLSVPTTSYVRTGVNGSATLPSVGGNPGAGLAIGQVWYDSVSNVLKYYDGSVRTLTNTSGAFTPGGNSLGGAATLGTNDNFNLSFETNNATQMTIDTSGNIGIGTTGPSQKIEVASGNLKLTSGSLEVAGAFPRTYFSNNIAQADLLLTGNYPTQNIPFIGRITNTQLMMGMYAVGSGGFHGLITSNADPYGSFYGFTYDWLNPITGNGGSGGLWARDGETRILASGNMQAKFDGISTGFFGYSNFAPSEPDLVLVRKRGTEAAQLAVQTGDALGSLKFSGTQHYNYDARIQAVVDTGVIGAQIPSKLEFQTGPGGATTPSVRMTILGNGNVGIGTGGPSEKLHVSGNLRVQGSTDCTLGNGAGGTNCSSDIRLKENIQPIQNALQKILSLSGVEFNWNENAASPGRHDIGVIAQEVEKVFPTTVIEDRTTGYKKVDYGALVSPLIQSTKELYGICTDQERQISRMRQLSETQGREMASLKAENAELKKRLDIIEMKLNGL